MLFAENPNLSTVTATSPEVSEVSVAGGPSAKRHWRGSLSRTRKRRLVSPLSGFAAWPMIHFSAAANEWPHFLQSRGRPPQPSLGDVCGNHVKMKSLRTTRANTARGGDALRVHQSRGGGAPARRHDSLTKPVDRQELLLRVKTFVKLRQQDVQLRHQVRELS